MKWERIGIYRNPTLQGLQAYQKWENQFKAGDTGRLDVEFKSSPNFYEGRAEAHTLSSGVFTGAQLAYGQPELKRWTGLVPKGVEPLEQFQLSSPTLPIDKILGGKGIKLWKPSELKGNTLSIYFRTGFPLLAVLGIALGALVVFAVVYSISLWKTVELEKEETKQYITNAVEGLSPEDKARILTGVVKEDKPTEPFKAPLIILAVFAGVAILLFAFLKGG